MKIEAGKYYLNAKGKVIGPIKERDSIRYPFYHGDDKTDVENWHLVDGGSDLEWVPNLISELTLVVSTTPYDNTQIPTSHTTYDEALTMKDEDIQILREKLDTLQSDYVQLENTVKRLHETLALTELELKRSMMVKSVEALRKQRNDD